MRDIIPAPTHPQELDRRLTHLERLTDGMSMNGATVCQHLEAIEQQIFMGWQKCPVCEGVGHMIPESLRIVGEYKECPTCHGKRIISITTGDPPAMNDDINAPSNMFIPPDQNWKDRYFQGTDPVQQADETHVLVGNAMVQKDYAAGLVAMLVTPGASPKGVGFEVALAYLKAGRKVANPKFEDGNFISARSNGIYMNWPDGKVTNFVIDASILLSNAWWVIPKP